MLIDTDLIISIGYGEREDYIETHFLLKDKKDLEKVDKKSKSIKLTGNDFEDSFKLYKYVKKLGGIVMPPPMERYIF